MTIGGETRPVDHADELRALAGADERDRELARRFAAGDVSCVRDLYARWAGPVYTVAIGRLHDRHLAEEAVQETFVKAWQASSTFDPRFEFAPWIYTIARRVAMDIARYERRRPQTTVWREPTPTAANADSGDAWEAWQIRSALRALPGHQRELIRLTHYVGLTQSEIAERLGLPLGTVKSRIRRAHHRLAERLAYLRVAS